MSNPFASPMFGDREHPAAPDYTDLANWNAHPESGADCLANNLAPAGDLSMPMDDRKAVCFFVQGTCYFGNLSFEEGKEPDAEPWNCPIPHPQANEHCDLDVASQASALNNRCLIFSPRYRQSCIPTHNKMLQASASEADRQISVGTMELASFDVERAFDHFLSLPQTQGKPIIIASHSQGTMHTARLMERFEKDTELRDRLICAYLLGPLGSMPLEKFEKAFPSLHPCKGPLDIQCVVSFDVVGDMYLADGDVHGMVRSKNKDAPTTLTYAIGSWENPFGKAMTCTNPLTWTSEPGIADAALHLGKITKMVVTNERTQPFNAEELWPPEPGAVGLKLVALEKVDVATMSAEILQDGGVLSRPGDGNHSEWEDFYFNIRENVAQRVDAFLAKQSAKTDSS